MSSLPTSPDEPYIVVDVDAPVTSPSEYRRVAMATMVGTTIEWYDFFIYANVAGLLFGKLFFSGLGEWAQLAAFATVGVSFFFRPAGAIAMGYVGDRWGRRIVLVLTLGLMGLATTLVGLLPTAEQIGVAAPLLLILLRCAQGFSAGGEWGGAAMLAVEHAPPGQRGKFGAYPQIGVPAGMLLAMLFLTVLAMTQTKEQFDAWGWRIPFIFSIVLVFIGQWIRSRIAESPVFEELKEAREHATAPQKELLKTHPKEVLLAAGSFIGNNAVGYMLVGGFVIGSAAAGGLARSSVLNWALISAAVWGVTTMLGAIWSDKIGRVRVYKIGYIITALWLYPMFWLIREGIDTQNAMLIGVGLIVMGIPLGLNYGPQSAMFAEMFPARIRLSGVSLAYAIGAVFGGAFAPTIAEYLTKRTGDITSVAWYLIPVTLVSLACVFFIKDRSQEPLHTMSGH
ncbi:MFS transporter [Gephyromycinifex aptenodytis]|uniref:MFS transporter n=1 Tax=Gephyromycinifex aptenodytis TaxID=2716227 RepID=UPI001444CA71|nr:MFS transporter [Gephyromycinifex aptenodytis]